jgi:NitT/TauT family transport system permease protein
VTSISLTEQVRGSGILAAQRRASRRRHRIIVLTSQILLAVVLLALWEICAGPREAPGTLVDEFYISRPSLIIDALRRWIDQDILWISIYVTLLNTVLGFLIGTVLGLVAGFALGTNRTLAEIMQPYITALYSIPRLALVPLFMLWFGIGVGMKLALIASVVFFLIFYATFAGVREVDQDMMDKLRLMRASWWGVTRKVTIPSAMSFIISGLRVSLPYALVVEVTAEMMSSNSGMGFLLIRSSSQFYTPGVFAAIVVMMVMGIVLTGGIVVLEKRLLGWKPVRERQ